MKLTKKKKIWLYTFLAIAIVLALSYWAFTPANILGIPYFSNAFAVIGPSQTAYTGDTFEHTFTLTNRDAQALPKEKYDTDGDGVGDTIVKLYKGYRLFDPVGTIVTTGCNTPDGSCNYVEEVSTPIASGGTTPISLVFTVTASTPSSFAGNPYGVSAMLFKVTQKWNRATNTWTETSSIIDSVDQNSNLAVKFAVSTQTPPPTPTPQSILNMFASLFANIWNRIKTLLGF